MGEHFSLTRFDQGWKGAGDEGQCIVKHNGTYYLLYSVDGQFLPQWGVAMRTGLFAEGEPGVSAAFTSVIMSCQYD